MEGNMLTRRHLIGTAAALTFITGAKAQAVETLKIFVPAAPGGGWDGTARTMELVLRNINAIKTAQVTNKGGAGGAVGLPEFLNQWKAQPNALMVAGMVMVGALLTNKSPFKIGQTVPIARLTGEYEVIVVNAESPIKTMADFVNALKVDPAKFAVGGGSAGGTDHILFAMIAKAVGVDTSKINYVAFAGGGPAQAAILGGHVAASIAGFGEYSEQIKAGKLRAIAISADKRQEGINVPTLIEQGVNVELANWRGVFAPPGVSDADKAAMVKLIETMAASKEWQEELKKRDWTGVLLTGEAFNKYIAAEEIRIGGILKDIGLVQ
jgi:putative tricarboxylic transport membrane protein